MNAIVKKVVNERGGFSHREVVVAGDTYVWIVGGGNSYASHYYGNGITYVLSTEARIDDDFVGVQSDVVANHYASTGGSVWYVRTWADARKAAMALAIAVSKGVDADEFIADYTARTFTAYEFASEPLTDDTAMTFTCATSEVEFDERANAEDVAGRARAAVNYHTMIAGGKRDARIRRLNRRAINLHNFAARGGLTKAENATIRRRRQKQNRKAQRSFNATYQSAPLHYFDDNGNAKTHTAGTPSESVAMTFTSSASETQVVKSHSLFRGVKGGNGYCGPAAIAATTGATTALADKVIRDNNGKGAVRGTHPCDVVNAINSLVGYSAAVGTHACLHRDDGLRKRVTLGKFIDEIDDGVYIISAGCHWVALSKQAGKVQMADSFVRIPCRPARFFNPGRYVHAKRGQLVCEFIRVVCENEVAERATETVALAADEKIADKCKDRMPIALNLKGRKLSVKAIRHHQYHRNGLAGKLASFEIKVSGRHSAVAYVTVDYAEPTDKVVKSLTLKSGRFISAVKSVAEAIDLLVNGGKAQGNFCAVPLDDPDGDELIPCGKCGHWLPSRELIDVKNDEDDWSWFQHCAECVAKARGNGVAMTFTAGTPCEYSVGELFGVYDMAATSAEADDDGGYTVARLANCDTETVTLDNIGLPPADPHVFENNVRLFNGTSRRRIDLARNGAGIHRAEFQDNGDIVVYLKRGTDPTYLKRTGIIAYDGELTFTVASPAADDELIFTQDARGFDAHPILYVIVADELVGRIEKKRLAPSFNYFVVADIRAGGELHSDHFGSWQQAREWVRELFAQPVAATFTCATTTTDTPMPSFVVCDHCDKIAYLDAADEAGNTYKIDDYNRGWVINNKKVRCSQCAASGN